MRGRSRCSHCRAGHRMPHLASAPATARPIDKGHFHDVFTSDVYDCDGTLAQDSLDVSGNFLFNQRGSSPFPYYRQSMRGTVVTTNLDERRHFHPGLHRQLQGPHDRRQRRRHRHHHRLRLRRDPLL